MEAETVDSAEEQQAKSQEADDRMRASREKRWRCGELLLAVRRAKLRRVQQLLDVMNADPECRGQPKYRFLPPLQLAASLGKRAHVEIVRVLLDAGADPNRSDTSLGKMSFLPALFYALGYNAKRAHEPSPATGHLRIAKLLLERGADVNAVEPLPSRNLYLNKKPPARYSLGLFTPLHWATLVGFHDGVRLLLEHDAFVNAPAVSRNKRSAVHNLTALHMAINGAGEDHQIDLIDVLLSHDADPFRTDSRQRTALHYAAMVASDTIITKIADAVRAQEHKDLQALLSATDETGRTALDIAELPPVFVRAARALRVAAGETDPEVRLPEAAATALHEARHNAWANAPRGEWNWELDGPLDSDRCDIERVDAEDLTKERFLRDFYHLRRPVIVTGNVTADWRAWETWTRPAMLELYGDKRLKGGPIAYGRAFKRMERARELQEFIRNSMHRADGEILKDAPANEPWILFDRDVTAGEDMIDDYDTPAYFQPGVQNQAQLSVGSFGSGASWHHHLSAFNVLLFGKKRWWMVPPALQKDVLYEREDPAIQYGHGLVASNLQPLTWYHTVFAKTLNKTHGEDMVQCTQGPGELLILPRLWSHTTINLSDTVCLAREFIREAAGQLYYLPFRNYRTRIDVIQRMFQP